jgi:signal transduction histidine kinase/CheY-like chemotaxis protein
MFLIPAIIYYLLSTTLTISHIQNLSKARTSEIKSVVNSAIGKTAALLITRGLKQDLIEVVQTLIKDTAVVEVIVYDVNNRIFAKSGTNTSNTKTEVYEHKLYHKPIVPMYDEFDFNDGITKGKPVLVGTLIFRIDQQIVKSQSLYTVIGDLILLLLIALICSPVFYALYLSFSRPLSSILSNILEFEKGRYDWIVHNDHSSDEFMRVQQSLKRVAVTLLNQTEQIQDANIILEQRAIELERNIQFAIEARKEADKANTQKDIFVANMTHEMRHPLVGVVSGIDLSEQFILCAQNRLMALNVAASQEQSAELSNARAELRDAINSFSISKTCSKELTLMVDDLLASIQDMYHEITLRPTTFLLFDSLHVLFSSYYDYAKAKSLEYNFSIKGIESDSALFVKGDWVRISQVINSLLDNAIRFTEQGIIIATAKVSVSNDNVDLTFIVSDTGVGISDLEKVSIFKLFHIGENPVDKKHSSLGTGLTIARKIAHKLHAHLNIDYSELGIGSRFSFNMTIPVSTNNDLIPDDNKPNLCKQTSLLYVEDSAVNRQVFQMYCDLFSINLIKVRNGIEGMNRFISRKFDALIIDCYMPKMNGYQLVQKIRQWEDKMDAGHITIFALTADASSRNQKKCFDAGFDEFLTKPYTKETLRFIIDRLGKNTSASI